MTRQGESVLARAIAAIIAGLILASAQANAGETACSTAVADASPFYCQLERIDSAQLQLKGTAAALGAKRPALEQIMRDRLDMFLTDLPKPTAAAASPLIAKRAHRGQLLCSLWTVGEDAAIALFVECALQSTATGDNVEARLLGRTSESEFDMAARVALGRVVSHVTTRYKTQREQRIALSATQQIKTAGAAR